MAAFAANEAGSSRFLTVLHGSSRFFTVLLVAIERVTILSMLEGCTNALAIYHGKLEKPAKYDNDILVSCASFDSNSTDSLMSNAQFNIDETIETTAAKEKAVAAKLYEDSLYKRKVMEDSKEEIREHETFELLTKEIEQITDRKKEEESLLKQQDELKRTLIALRQMIADEDIANEEKKKRMLYELAEEQRSIEKMKLTAEAEEKYVTDWEKTRYEENQLEEDKEIQELEKMLNDFRVREKNEERVYDELTKFLLQEKESFEKETKEWEERYVREKEVYEKEILQLRIDIEERRKELEELKEEYERNEEFIDTCLAEKEALERQKEHEEQEERTRRSAIRIQAWWRGVMIRRMLGPNRAEEKNEND